MTVRVEFKFNHFNNVKIIAIGVVGFVISLMYGEGKTNEYRVTYWLEGSRKTDWFYESELEAA